MNTQKSLKMFVLVRKDLNETYRNVQGCHSVAEYSLRGDKDLFNEWNNHTLIHLGVKDEWSLKRWKEKLKVTRKPIVEFYEPDLDYQLTAIACIDTGEVFKKLQLA
jgi:hypothetical protein